MPAGFDFGTITVRRLKARNLGFSTRPSRYSSWVKFGAAEAKTSAGAPWRIWSARVFEPAKL